MFCYETNDLLTAVSPSWLNIHWDYSGLCTATYTETSCLYTTHDNKKNQIVCTPHVLLTKVL